MVTPESGLITILSEPN